MELVLGIFFGFMLGWLALLCFCENRASKRFWHGLCIGMGEISLLARQPPASASHAWCPPRFPSP